MVDKVKPFKLENPSSGGTETNRVPTELDPAEDYVSTKGVSFEGLDSFLIDKIGRFLSGKVPDTWIVPAYNGNGDFDNVQYYNSSGFINANRIARVDFSYDVNLDPSAEIWSIYDTNGTTVLRTITYTITMINSDPTQIKVAFS